MFKKDENGKNRNWRDIEENQIRELHQKCKSQMEEVINHFKHIMLPKAALTVALNQCMVYFYNFHRRNT